MQVPGCRIQDRPVLRFISSINAMHQDWIKLQNEDIREAEVSQTEKVRLRWGRERAVSLSLNHALCSFGNE